MNKWTALFIPLVGWHVAGHSSGVGPDAGAMMRMTEFSASAHDTPVLEALPPEYSPRLRWNDDFSVRVDAIEVHGNHLLPDEKLQAALKVYVGKRLSVESVPRLARIVTKTYRDAGYKVRAYVPDQSFGHNRVVIQVIEPTTLR